MIGESEKPAEQSSGQQCKRRWWRKKRVIGPLILVVLASGWWLRETYLYPVVFWYRVTATLEYQGEPVEVGGVVTCQRGRDFWDYITLPFNPLRTFTAGPPNGIVTYPYFSDTAAFAQQLPDGSGVIVQHELSCNRNAHQIFNHESGPIQIYNGLERDYGRDLPAHRGRSYFPLVHWIDDTREPKAAELYFADIYFDAPEARMRFLGLAVERLSWADVGFKLNTMEEEKQKLLSEIPWLAKVWPVGTIDPNIFTATVGYVFGEEEWRDEPRAAALVEGTENGNIIVGDLEDEPALMRGFSYPGSYSLTCLDDEAPGSVKNPCAALDRIRIFRNVDGIYVPDEDKPIPGKLDMEIGRPETHEGKLFFRMPGFGDKFLAYRTPKFNLETSEFYILKQNYMGTPVQAKLSTR